jgi:hypothetical protein
MYNWQAALFKTNDLKKAAYRMETVTQGKVIR